MRNDPVHRSPRSSSATVPSGASSAKRIALGPTLWFDQTTYALCTPEKTVLLTPHEARVLEALLDPPNQCPFQERSLLLLPGDQRL